MKIAITGGTGLLGRYFVRCINEQGIHTPVIISRKKFNTYEDEIFRTTDYSIADLTGILTDIDAVVHLASERGNYTKLKDYHISTDITQNLYEACKNKNIFNIVYASSISVYSQQIFLPWHEKLLLNPVSMYGISKLIGEHLGYFYIHKYGLNIKNLRLAHLFGRNEQNDYMINKFMRQAYAKEALVLFSKSSAKREFLYAKDAAQAILKAVEAKTTKGTFNVGSDEVLTNQQIAENINRAFHNDGNLCFAGKEEKLIESSYMTSEKAYLELGFKAKYCFYEAMEDIYREMQNV